MTVYITEDNIGLLPLEAQVTELSFMLTQARQETAEWRAVAHSVANRTDELRSIIDSLRDQLAERDERRAA